MEVRCDNLASTAATQKDYNNCSVPILVNWDVISKVGLNSPSNDTNTPYLGCLWYDPTYGTDSDNRECYNEELVSFLLYE